MDEQKPQAGQTETNQEERPTQPPPGGYEALKEALSRPTPGAWGWSAAWDSMQWDGSAAWG